VWKWITGKTKTQLPAAAKGMQIYAVGDIHGRADLLNKVFKQIDADAARHAGSQIVEVYLGDYIDRGPASREVLDLLIERGRARSAVFVKGNHETYPFEFLRNPEFLVAWGQLGGLDTLMSYGLRPALATDPAEQIETARAFAAALPLAHRDFLQSLRPSFTSGDFFFVHAGVRVGVPLSEQSEEDLMDTREPFLSSSEDFGKIVVHGHTPAREPEFRPNRINIDTGAYATNKLTCLAINGDRLWIL
jgi:serine/threonine protein phosphatase 1